jgi:addiction module RelE/StbE family toxin
MQRPIIWSPQALNDIESALDYLLERSPQAARRVYRDVMQHIEHLAEYPFSGRIGRVAGTREWVIPKTPFIIPYRVHQEHLEIIRVFHSARQWPKGF